MAKPTLLVIAGCNGSGKSTFSKLLTQNNPVPFDYDSVFLKHYSQLLNIDIKENMAHNMAYEELQQQVEYAINSSNDFCYETNFHETPMFWPSLFKKHGYTLRMIYLCLNSINEAKKRVTIRVQNGGHFVPEKEITKRYKAGFSNLDQYYKEFDSVDLFDTSTYGKEPSYLFSIEENKIINQHTSKRYLSKLIPNILSLPTGK